MISCLITISLTGGMIGWLLTNNIIIFVPNWFGTLIFSVILTYFTTLSTSLGDILRYLSYHLYQFLLIINLTLNDVKLKEKINVLFFKLFEIFKYMDKKYNIIEKIQVIFNYFIKELIKVIKR